MDWTCGLRWFGQGTCIEFEWADLLENAHFRNQDGGGRTALKCDLAKQIISLGGG